MSPEIVLILAFLIGMTAGIIVSTINMLITAWVFRSKETKGE